MTTLSVIKPLYGGDVVGLFVWRFEEDKNYFLKPIQPVDIDSIVVMMLKRVLCSSRDGVPLK